MLRNFHLLLRAGACIALAGCAPAPVSPPAVGAEPGVAVIVGWGNTMAENARAALTAEPGTRVSALFVAQANEQKFSLGHNVVRLAPGDYGLTIRCSLYIGSWYYHDEDVIRTSLAGGRLYRLRAQPDGRRCEAYLEDVTGKPGEN